MRHNHLIPILIFILFFALPARAHVEGLVVDENGQPLIGANLHWLGTTIGTSSSFDGSFEIEKIHATRKLVTSYIGYLSDTTTVLTESVTIVLFPENTELGDVTVAARRQSVVRSRVSALNTQRLNADELCKAACCNLSESFETSASVDVAYADAATGAKQIRLLGLSGRYVQLLTENTPGIRGLAQNFGMEYIPGPWMESIQVSKGTSSVVNGYESLTGQINVEYLKPKTQDPIAVNLMLNTELHAEANLTGGWDVGEHAYTGLLAHYQKGTMAMDDNHDGFLDMPLSDQLNLLHRWDIFKGDYTGRILVHGLYDRRRGGNRPTTFHKTTLPEEPYLIDLRTRRADAFMKNGYVIDDDKQMSIGIITAASYHSQDNIYGDRQWTAGQWNVYLNALFQTNIGEQQKLTAGLSLNHDDYDETINGMIPRDVNASGGNVIANADLSRRETAVGAFAEYSYDPNDMLSLLVGLRGDYLRQCYLIHSPNSETQHRFLPTPRLNLRFAPWSWWTIRASVGMGYRTPNLIADNAALLSSGRLVNTLTTPQLESALNAGLTTTFYIPVADRELQINAEYYYTHFFDCLVADIEQNGVMTFTNLSDMPGARAFAHTMQVEATAEILRGWTMTLAYRLSDSRQTVFSPSQGNYMLLERPLQNRFKALITTSYQTPLKKWQFDFTAQFNGYGRMPEGFVIPIGAEQQYFQRNGQTYHQWYPQLLGQVTKYWRTCSLYLGAENMTNFRQLQPITAAETPFNNAFDAAQVWAPTTGWKIYIGFRWNLTRDE